MIHNHSSKYLFLSNEFAVSYFQKANSFCGKIGPILNYSFSSYLQMSTHQLSSNSSAHCAKRSSVRKRLWKSTPSRCTQSTQRASKDSRA